MKGTSMALPLDEALRTFGSVVRAARQARHMTQAELAGAAGVSLAQLALFEKGRNVSLLFLLKVANALGLSISLDESARSSAAHRDLDVFELVRITDLFAALVERLRDFATNAVLPPSERGRLEDARAVEEFIARHTQSEEGVARLVAAMEKLSTESDARGHARPSASLSKSAKRRARKGEE